MFASTWNFLSPCTSSYILEKKTTNTEKNLACIVWQQREYENKHETKKEKRNFFLYY